MLRRCFGFIIFLGSLHAAGTSVRAAATVQKMYWLSGSGLIYRANLDGSNIEPMAHWGTNDPNPQGLAIDPSAGKMYWTANSFLKRANLEIPQGETFETRTDIETLFSLDGNNGPVAIDALHGKIYWGNNGNGSGVHRANFDGTGQEILVASQDGGYLVSGLALAIPATPGVPVVSSFGLIALGALISVAGTFIFAKRFSYLTSVA